MTVDNSVIRPGTVSSAEHRVAWPFHLSALQRAIELFLNFSTLPKSAFCVKNGKKSVFGSWEGIKYRIAWLLQHILAVGMSE